MNTNIELKDYDSKKGGLCVVLLTRNETFRSPKMEAQTKRVSYILTDYTHGVVLSKAIETTEPSYANLKTDGKMYIVNNSSNNYYPSIAMALESLLKLLNRTSDAKISNIKDLKTKLNQNNKIIDDILNILEENNINIYQNVFK